MKKFVLLIGLIGIVAGLFISSNQTYEQQTIVPDLEHLLPDRPFEEPLSKLQISYWGKTISVEERGYYYFMEFLIRKAAHFFTFGALAAVLYWLFSNFRSRFFIAAFLTFLAAAGDEFHQMLTGGRTATLQDVGLDMSGALTFLLIIHFFVSVRTKLGRSRLQKHERI